VPSHFCLSIRFLDSAFHGRRDGGTPEWPPSPLRVFQALVATAARCRRPGQAAALKWLEAQPPPVLIAPAGIATLGYSLSVPNNAMDIVANAWSRGNDSNSGDANPATHRTMKSVRRTLVTGGPVHYLWPLSDPVSQEIRAHAEALSGIARNVVALGWGVDLAVGNGATVSHEQMLALVGERWVPGIQASGDGLRAPVDGTFDALTNRHQQFLNRLGPDGFAAPAPLSAYRALEYRRPADSPVRPTAAFSLLKLDASGFQAFDTSRRGLTVAGMIKFATKAAAERGEWPDKSFVLGHTDPNGGEHVAVGPRRFAYLPLPSIEGRGTGNARALGSIRRAIVTTFAEDCEKEIAWARRSLSGQELIDEDKKQPIALLSLIPTSEKVVQYYTQSATTWATVTPVVLPGYDDPSHYRRRLKRGTSAGEQGKLLGQLADRVERLLRKAIIQAGLSQTLADHAEIEWRKSGFWPGSDLPDRYGIPDHLKRFPRYHVKIQWRDENKMSVQVPGPICIGGGRFYGLGLFAAL
jgi:CRISPR-associated protein Csb2